MHRRIALVIVTFAGALLPPTPALLAQMPSTPAPAAQIRGAQDLGSLGGGSTEVRLDRLERMLNERSLSDLVLQVQRLQQELQDLRGQVEVQQYRMQQMMSRNPFAGLGAGTIEPPLPGGHTALLPGNGGGRWIGCRCRAIGRYRG